MSGTPQDVMRMKYREDKLVAIESNQPTKIFRCTPYAHPNH